MLEKGTREGEFLKVEIQETAALGLGFGRRTANSPKDVSDEKKPTLELNCSACISLTWGV